MALILNIDTSTSICSVALARDGNTISLKENKEGLNHSVLLGSYIDDILKDNQITANQLDAVAISMGPGSYTGLRIGVSMAKGLCFAAGKPLIAINTLQALALAVSSSLQEDAWYCPMIDARRMEVYTAFFNRNNDTLVDTKAEIINEDSFADILSEHLVYFFGNGSAKIKNTLTGNNVRYLEDIETSAQNLAQLSEQKFQEKQFEDIAYFEPFYLKDFIATVPKQKVL